MFAIGFNLFDSVSIASGGNRPNDGDSIDAYHSQQVSQGAGTKMAFGAVASGSAVNATTGVVMAAGQAAVGSAGLPSSPAPSLAAGTPASATGVPIPRLPGDVDNNRSTDLEDFAFLLTCSDDPSPPSSGSCVIVDLNNDGRITLQDLGMFQTVFSAPQ
jgi:hypothetical protein